MSQEFKALSAHPSTQDVSRMLIIPFVSSQCVLIRQPSGELSVPEWREGMGRNYLHGAYLAPLQQAGVRLQQFHPFAYSSDDVHFIAGWVDGQLRETEAERLVLSPEDASGQLQEQGNSQLADLVRWATKSYRNQSDESYNTDVHILLEESYLAAETVYGGSGFGGDAAHWRMARGPIADSIHKSGTFLDIGCANGLLMESVVSWAAEKDHQIEPYGMDISAPLANVARQRLPQWADRIFVGNVLNWEPPHPFDFVSIDIGYVVEERRRELVEKLLADFVKLEGRLIITSYGLTKFPAKESWSVGEHLRSLGFVVGGEPERFDTVKSTWKRIAYIDKTG